MKNMKSRLSLRSFAAGLTLACAVAANSGNAQVVSLHILPSVGTDAAIGISSSNQYTHAFDFAEGSSTSVNGVTFTNAFPDGDTGSGISGKFSTNPITWTDGVSGNDLTLSRSTSPKNGDSIQGAYSGTLGINPLADGDSAAFFNSFGLLGGAASQNQAGSVSTFTLDGLVDGNTYSARLYGLAWTDDADMREIMVGIGDESLLVDWTDVDDNGIVDAGAAFYIDMVYTAAGTSQAFTLTVQDAGRGPHMAGFTNQLELTAVPEPSTYALLAGAFALVLPIYRRLRSKRVAD